jgi:hypothetical protein
VIQASFANDRGDLWQELNVLFNGCGREITMLVAAQVGDAVRRSTSIRRRFPPRERETVLANQTAVIRIAGPANRGMRRARFDLADPLIRGRCHTHRYLVKRVVLRSRDGIYQLPTFQLSNTHSQRRPWDVGRLEVGD